MKYEVKQGKNYTARDYAFDKALVRYIIMEETERVFMLIVPKEQSELIDDTFFTVNYDEDYPDHRDWFPGSLVHLHLGHHINSSYGNSYKFSQSTTELKFSHQDIKENDDEIIIETYLAADEGYSVCHTLKAFKGVDGFMAKSRFINNTGKKVTLEMLSSVSLDNLSPFTDDDSSESAVFHTFKGGWSIEGKHVEQTLPEMNMEKSWGGSFENERIGSIGSKSVGRYFPYAVLEDRRAGCLWGVKIKHNATWQMELTRYGVKLSISAGLGDLSYGGWFKEINDGGEFESPEAYVAAVRGDIADVSDAVMKICERDIDDCREEGLPIIYNEWCTTWGKPTHDGLLKIADRLKDTNVKYFVVDAGWFEGGNGEWRLKKEAFPYGMKAFASEIRKRGMVPGVWMEYECVDKGSKRFSEEYDGLYLSKNGETLIGTINNSYPEKFINFKNEEAVRFLDKAVIGFLKENDIGYMKIDYNTNIGLGCDGAESLGEGLRQHMEAVYDYIKKIKREISGFIIENCASGGSRLDPKMVGVTAMSSFSDAHESFEIPVVAANLQYLVPPRQCQVWCVLRNSFDYDRMMYICAAGFLGRLCWSGDICELSEDRFEFIHRTESLYNKLADIIRDGSSRIYRNSHQYNCRKLTGAQAVVRYSSDRDRAMVVYHCFDEPGELEILLNGGYEIEEQLFESKSHIENGRLVIDTAKARVGNVLYLKRK